MTTTKSVADELRELASDLKAFYSLPGIAEHIMEIADCLDREAEERNSGREWWAALKPFGSGYMYKTARSAEIADIFNLGIIHVREVKP